MRRLALFPILIFLAGCVTGSPETLFTPPPVIQGKGNSTGAFPVIGVQPQRQTEQLTPEEIAATKAELQNDVAPAQSQAASNQEADYRREISELQKLATSQREARLKEIESRQFSTD